MMIGKKLLAGILSCMVPVMAMAGCGSQPSSSQPSSSVPSSTAAATSQEIAATTAGAPSSQPDPASAGTEISGKISMSGSTSMEEVVKALAEDFMSKNQGVTIDAQFNGSGQGVKDAQEGKADIGNCSRELTADETGLKANVIAIDGIAVVIHPENPVTDLTMDQLTKIYTGEIRNWKDVGGNDQNIVVIGRDAASGTRGAFEEILGVKDQCAYAQEKDSTGGVKTAVQTTPEAIGYVSLEAADADDTVKKLTLDGAEATEDAITDGTYKLSRPFIMATKEGDLRPEVQAFLDYVLSSGGQAVVKSLKLITVGD